MMRTYRVYFSDGNQRLYEARNIVECINYVANVSEYLPAQIEKVEEVQ